MAITSTNLTNESRSFTAGDGLRLQLKTWSAISGATSGTVTADGLQALKAILVTGGRLIHTAAPTFSGNVATLAFTVPAETAASQTKGGVTITAAADQGASGNSITLAYTGGATAGAEVVTVTGTAISVQIENGVSTITQVRTAINASAAAAALVTATGTSATVVATAAATPCAGGVTGGGRGVLLCLGT